MSGTGVGENTPAPSIPPGDIADPATTAAAARPFGAALRLLVNLIVAFGLLALVVWRASPWKLGEEFSDFDPWPAAAALALNVPLLAVITWRGQAILARLGYSVPFLSLLPISTLGNVAGSLTPAAAGELLRTPFFRDRGIADWDGFAAISYERGSSMLTLALSTGAAAAWMTLGAAGGVAVTLACVALSLLLPPIAALVLRFLRGEESHDEHHLAQSLARRFRALLGRSFDSLRVLLRDPAMSAGIGAANVIVFAIMSLQLWLCVDALGLQLNAAEAWTALGASLLVGIVSLLPLGLGTTDATMAALIGAAEDGFHAGAAATVLFRALSTLPLGIAAVASYVYLSTTRRRQEVAT